MMLKSGQSSCCRSWLCRPMRRRLWQGKPEQVGRGRCGECRRGHSDSERARKRALAQERLPVEVRQQLLDAIYSGQPFRTVLLDLGLTSNQVLGLTKTNQEWSEKLDTALTATRRDHVKHGTTLAYVHGCVCSGCRAHQRVRMARNRG
jgi:hypothetical protein